ncbi:MAG TPA: adenosylcobinamide-phosphate synthase CbiB [Alphaproteobacteria bacterium]|nr:adenosylcobinamide-phosphate synthase CbiB [Alphaproteobacteria bacterium]
MTLACSAAMVAAMLPSAIDPFFALLAGLALDAVAGEMRLLFRFFPHPVVAIGSVIAALDRRLNREARGRNALRVRGALVALVVVAIAALCGWLVLTLSRLGRWGWLIEVFAIGVLVAQRSLYDHVFAVCRALESGGLAAGRDAVSKIVGRDPNSLDEYAVARAGTESLFENFSDGVVAPAFWYLLLGLPGLFAYKAVNTLDSMIGHRNARYIDFGAFAARLDTAANFVPARLAALIIAAAAAVAPKGSPAASLKAMLRDARKHRSVNAGWPEAAAAGALGLALAGPRRYGAELVSDPWIGDGRARVTPADMRRALYLFVAACLVHAALIAILAIAVNRL